MNEADQDQYDVIGELYERVKRLPMGIAEQATLLEAIEPVKGRSVLDVACGTGFYPRLFRQLGASKVVAADASREMIAYAKRLEAATPLGIDYELADATALPQFGLFDIVSAVWLLGYAQGEDQLVHMLCNLRRNIAPNGQLIAVVPNPELDFDRIAEFSKYGLSVQKLGVVAERQACKVTVLGENPFEFDTFLWPTGVMENAMKAAGFIEIERCRTILPQSYRENSSEEECAALLGNTSFAVYRARLA
jgi:2-polyprenyl-3-methyl-5-hydroxy-6-metoxy-1,4-benzoquinol methylase